MRCRAEEEGPRGEKIIFLGEELAVLGRGGEMF